jgi:hypothetical protein
LTGGNRSEAASMLNIDAHRNNTLVKKHIFYRKILIFTEAVCILHFTFTGSTSALLPVQQRTPLAATSFMAIRCFLMLGTVTRLDTRTYGYYAHAAKMETMPVVGAPSSNGSSSYNWGPPPEDYGRNN